MPPKKQTSLANINARIAGVEKAVVHLAEMINDMVALQNNIMHAVVSLQNVSTKAALFNSPAKERLVVDKTLPLDDQVLTFGKHRGKSPNQLLEDSHDYLIWVYENIDNRRVITDDLYRRAGGKKPFHPFPGEKPPMRTDLHEFDNDDIPF